MTQQLVLIGLSPAQFFLARALDRELAQLVHLNVLWLVKDDELTIGTASFPGLSNERYLNIKKELKHVRVVRSSIRSINLKERRIVTTKGSTSYNFLVIDKYRGFGRTERGEIRKQLRQLCSLVKSGSNINKNNTARVAVESVEPEMLQVALAIVGEVRHVVPELVRRIEVAVTPNEGALPARLKQFLANNGVAVGADTGKPGLRIASPAEEVKNSSIKGLHIDGRGVAVTDASRAVKGYPEVLMLDGANRAQIATWRAQKSLADQVRKVVEQHLAGKGASEMRTGSIELRPLYLLQGVNGRYLQIAKHADTGIKARTVAYLERSALKPWRDS